jgi:hypothetical protein
MGLERESADRFLNRTRKERRREPALFLDQFSLA